MDVFDELFASDGDNEEETEKDIPDAAGGEQPFLSIPVRDSPSVLCTLIESINKEYIYIKSNEGDGDGLEKAVDLLAHKPLILKHFAGAEEEFKNHKSQRSVTFVKNFVKKRLELGICSSDATSPDLLCKEDLSFLKKNFASMMRVLFGIMMEESTYFVQSRFVDRNENWYDTLPFEISKSMNEKRFKETAEMAWRKAAERKAVEYVKEVKEAEITESDDDDIDDFLECFHKSSHYSMIKESLDSVFTELNFSSEISQTLVQDLADNFIKLTISNEKIRICPSPPRIPSPEPRASSCVHEPMESQLLHTRGRGDGETMEHRERDEYEDDDEEADTALQSPLLVKCESKSRNEQHRSIIRSPSTQFTDIDELRLDSRSRLKWREKFESKMRLKKKVTFECSTPKSALLYNRMLDETNLVNANRQDSGESTFMEMSFKTYIRSVSSDRGKVPSSCSLKHVAPGSPRYQMLSGLGLPYHAFCRFKEALLEVPEYEPKVTLPTKPEKFGAFLHPVKPIVRQSLIKDYLESMGEIGTSIWPGINRTHLEHRSSSAVIVSDSLFECVHPDIARNAVIQCYPPGMHMNDFLAIIDKCDYDQLGFHDVVLSWGHDVMVYTDMELYEKSEFAIARFLKLVANLNALLCKKWRSFDEFGYRRRPFPRLFVLTIPEVGDFDFSEYNRMVRIMCTNEMWGWFGEVRLIDWANEVNRYGPERLIGGDFQFDPNGSRSLLRLEHRLLILFNMLKSSVGICRRRRPEEMNKEEKMLFGDELDEATFLMPLPCDNV